MTPRFNAKLVHLLSLQDMTKGFRPQGRKRHERSSEATIAAISPGVIYKFVAHPPHATIIKAMNLSIPTCQCTEHQET